MKFLSVNHLTTSYGKHIILSDLSFEVDDSETIGILGANGSGKTTLLKAICGILPHSGFCQLEGTILEDKNPRNLAKLCSYIPQRSGISIDISVLDIVLMGFHPYLGFLEHPSSQMKEKAMKILNLVGLSGKEHRNYLHLSEGQKQLCILARTLVTDSKLLLLDEPESALDFHFRYQMLELIQKWNKETHSTSLISLHDPMLALNCCDKLLLLSEGHITSTICPQTDTLSDLEKKLSHLYGNISLHYCVDKSGKKQIVMLKENLFESTNQNHFF